MSVGANECRSNGPYTSIVYNCYVYMYVIIMWVHGNFPYRCVFLSCQEGIWRWSKTHTLPVARWQVIYTNSVKQVTWLVLKEGIHTNVYFKIRAWKNQLRSVKSDSQQDLYQTLSILESESDRTVFHERMSKFLQLWRNKEPSFVRYFEEYYSNRPGVYSEVSAIA